MPNDLSNEWLGNPALFGGFDSLGPNKKGFLRKEPIKRKFP